MKKLVVIFIALLALACSRVSDPRLLRAEALMDSLPESALCIVRAIDTAALRGDANRALYGLLLTQGCHKCDIPATDDSLITAAARYLAHHGTPRRAMLARFYQAAVQYNAGHRAAALSNALPALDQATRLQDTYWMARAHELIADLYYDSYNMDVAIEHYTAAAKYFEEDAKYLNKFYCLTTIARAINHIGDIERSLSMLDSIGSAMQPLDNVAQGFLYESYLRPLVAQGRSKEAARLHQRAMELFAGDTQGVVDWIDVATVYDMCGLESEATEAYNNGITEENVPSQKFIYKYKKHKAANEYPAALSNLEAAYEYSSQAYNAAIAQNFDAVFKQFYEDRLLAERESKTKMFWISLILLIALVILTILSILHYKNKIKIKEQEIELHISQARNLLDDLNKTVAELADVKNESECLTTELACLRQENAASKDEVAALANKLAEKDIIVSSAHDKFMDQWNHVRTQLDKELKKLSVERSENNALVQSISLAKNIFLSDSVIEQLEKYADEKSGQGLSELVKLVPGLTVRDRNILTFIIHGFSSQSICALLDEKIANYYNRLSRIRKRVNNSGNDKAIECLNNILRQSKQ